jgi:hypothetical protein
MVMEVFPVSASGDVNPADLIEQLAAMPDRLDAAVATLGAREAQPNVDGWSPRELAGHLCDASRYWGARIRLVALEERPTLPSYDQDTFVALAAYRYILAADLARIFRATSGPLVSFLRGLEADAWSREGVHEERGPLSLLQLAIIEVGHEAEHIAQIEQLGSAAQ